MSDNSEIYDLYEALLSRQSSEILWTDGEVDIDTGHGVRRVPAKILGEFCVHPMYKAKGFTISIVNSGYRFTSKGRVPETEEWAKRLAEIIMPLSNNWDNYLEYPMPQYTQKLIVYIHDVAECLDAFLKSSIDPSDRVVWGRVKKVMIA